MSIYKLQHRGSGEQGWTFSCTPGSDPKRRFDNASEAHEALIDCINEWRHLSHRVVRIGGDGEPLEVVGVFEIRSLIIGSNGRREVAA